MKECMGTRLVCQAPAVRAFLALIYMICTLLAFSACGDDRHASKAGRSDAELAAKIDANARLRQEERDAREREAARQKATTQLAGADSLPAGSAEIEGGGSSRSSNGLLSAADLSSFQRLGARLSGTEGVAVAPLGVNASVSRAGSLSTGVAWSTAKVPVAMAVVASGGASAHESDLRQAITASDNAAAERLWSALGEGANAAAAATQQLRAAGDNRTQIQARRLRSGYTAFGQTAWELDDQARFMAGISCAKAGPAVLTLMNQVVAGQRWGLGSTSRQAQFKAGWGPGISPGSADGWLDRQMGILTIGDKPIAVAIATSASEHGTGTANLTAIASWVQTHVDASSAPSRASC